ncbi:MAG: HisA/HisF-related TIM barrel protein [Terriglobales bacterium]
MIFPCVDVMRGKVVQLVRGRVPALELDPSPELLARFAAFPQIHVIDLDAALDRGSNAALITPWLAAWRVRVGGGIRTAQSARQWLARGAYRVIVGTAAFNQDGIHRELLRQIPRRRLIIALDSSQGRVVVRGWRKSLDLSAEEAVRELEPYCSGFLCTCVDKEGMMQGTDLAWFRRLRRITGHELTAAGGIASMRELRALARLDIHAALGMSVYTGRLSLAALAAFGRARVAPKPPGKIAPEPPIPERRSP